MANQNNAKKNNGSASGGRKRAGTSAAAKTSSLKTRSTGRTSGKKSSGRSSRKTKISQGIPMKNEIQLVASFGIMLIMMLSNFGLCGVVGVWLSSFFFGIFGCVQYVMPVAFFLMVTVLLANDYSLLAMKKCGAGFVVLTMVSAYAQLICRQDVREFYDLFTVAATDRGAGGILGGGISLLLQSWFGTPGAIVIISCILLLALILLTQRSFVGFFRQGIARIRKAWKEAEEKRRQAARERATAQDKLREKQCEEKIKEMEEKKAEKEAASKDGEELQPQTDGRRASGNARRAAAKKRKQPDIRIHIPLFTPEDEVKKKDSLKELHPEIYPFTEEDGKTDAFNGSLDFSSLSLNEETTRKLFSDEPAGEKQDIFTAGFSETSPVESEEMTGSAAPVREECQTVMHDMDEQVQGTVSENEIQEAPKTAEKKTVQEEPETTAEKMVRNVPKAAAGDAGKNAQAGSLVSGPAGSTSNAGATSAQPASAPSNPPLRRQAKKEEYIFPPVNLLVTEKQKLPADYDRTLKETAMKLQSTLESFGVRVTITDISCGPTVTRYEMFPEQGTKVSKILSLTDDIKLNLAASDIRIEAPIPGKAAIGIEVPNKQNMTVHFRELIDNRVFKNFKSRLAFAVGKDIGGKIVVADLAKMPHLLIAGATGSGKSVCINTLIMSILYKARPTEVKLIMIDPKMVELSTYNGIPHLLIPVVTDPKKASGALNWAVAEMTDRYKKFTETGVRNIEGYNKKVDELIASGQVDEEKMNRMPQIVIIIDELADLMMVAPGEVEDAIVRLSQLARAAGIHLVIATQRPSVNVITGLIKANVPSRIAFSVSSGVDSRTIIDMNGAEKLLGKGDMLFYPSGYQKPVRVQGAFVSDAEVSQVVEFLKENEDVAVYDTEVSEKIENKIKNGSISSERDEYFEAAARFIMEKDKATIGMLQRMFKIGFNRAARIIDQLADAGIVGPEEGTKPRKILMSPEQLDAFFEENL